MRVLLPVVALTALTALLGCAKAPDGSLENVVQDLIETSRHRSQAERLNLLDSSSPLFRSTLAAGWAQFPSEGRKGENSLWAMGDHSSLVFHLAEVRPLLLTLTCRPFVVPDQKQAVAVFLNNSHLTDLELSSSKADYQVQIPAISQRLGENHLVLRYRYNRSPKEVRESKDSRSLAVAWYQMELEEVRQSPFPATEKELILGPETTQEFHAHLPPRSTLHLSADFDLQGSRLPIIAEARREGEKEPLSVELNRQRPSAILPLTQEQSALVKITLKTGASEEKGADPLFVRLSQALVSSASPEAQPTKRLPEIQPEETRGESTKPNILVYLIDTLRADRLGCYGNKSGLTPHMDELAADGLLVEQALSQAPWTRPAVASLFTGQWPPAHGAVQERSPLPDSAPSLPAHLQRQGYYTAGFVANPQVGAAFGFHRGFDEYHELRRGKDRYLRDSSRLLYREALNWLEKGRTDQPFFLYVHTIDPHAPYTPDDTYRSLFAADVASPILGPEEESALEAVHRDLGAYTYFSEGDPNLGSIPWMKGLEDGQLPSTPERTADLIRLYEAEIAFNDHYFGKLVQRLKSSGLYEDTLIILVADHGEEFHEHGHWEHGKTLYAQGLRVPLILKPPAEFQQLAGQRASRGQLVDILPTILHLLGDHVPGVLEGRSLFAGAETEQQDRPIFSHVHTRDVLGASVQVGSWKLIRLLDESSHTELYDLQADPGELNNLTRERPVRTGYLLDMIWHHQLRTTSKAESQSVEVDAETQAELQALGYL